MLIGLLFTLLFGFFFPSTEPVMLFGVFFEGFGIQGAALASIVARLFGVCLWMRHLFVKGFVSHKLSEWKMKIDVIKDLVHLGIPASMERLFMRFGQVIYFGMIIRIGTEVYAAHTLAGSFTDFCICNWNQFQATATTLVGKSNGTSLVGYRSCRRVKRYFENPFKRDTTSNPTYFNSNI